MSKIEKDLPFTLTNEDKVSEKGKLIKEVAKKICEESGCHHKCKEIDECVVMEEAEEVIANNATTLIEELRSKKSRDNRELLDRAANKIEELELLLINQDKSNNFEVKSNNFDVKSNEELFKQALVEGLNRHFDKTIEEAKKIEQIEEMAYEMTQYKGKMCERIEHNKCLLKFHTHAFINCNYCKLAEHLITEKNYRKQSEGEWKRQKGRPEAICSECGREVVYQVIDNKWAFENFCPHCGAKMKGGAK